MNNTNSYYQEDLLLLSSTLSKMLKQRFGKGPETCFVTLHSNRLIVFIRKYITPAEEVLLKNKQLSLVQKFRSAVMEEVIEHFAKEASDCLDLTFDSYFDDWNFDQNTGLMILENNKIKEWSDTSIHPIVKEKLFDKIIQLSDEVYKAPSSIEVIRINQNMYAAECHGSLIQIEKVLYKKGHLDLLQDRSIEIKKSYLTHIKQFEPIFGTRVEDLFMIWDYKDNRNYIFFYLQ